jgi:YggT family protein
MSTVWAAIDLVLFLTYLLVIARLVVETTRSFSRSWRPAGVTAIGLEAIYVVTDPPMKFIRRHIPPVTLGGVSLDLSPMILFVLLIVLRAVVGSIGGF